MQPYVMKGFEALNGTPKWYWYLLAELFIDTLGFRALLRNVTDGYLSKFVTIQRNLSLNVLFNRLMNYLI